MATRTDAAVLTVVLDANSTVIAAGDASLVAPVGGSIMQGDPTPILSTLAEGEECYWDTTGAGLFAKRPRPAFAAVQADRADLADIRTQLQAALNNWATLTAAQKDALLKVCVRAALRATR